MTSHGQASARWQDRVRPVLTAVQFLTRVPVPAWVGHGPGQLERAARWFPLVGLLVGLVGAGVLALARLGFPPMLAAILSTAVTVLLTGAFHEDGLADACDGLFGGWTRDDALRIMKDSRIGTFGAAGLGLVLAAKVACLSVLPPLALVAAHASSRFWALTLVAGQDYVRDGGGGKAKPVAEGIDASGLLIAALCGVLPGVLMGGGGRGALAVLLAGLPVWLIARWVHRRLGGYTGDVLGMVQQIAELAVYLVLAWRGVGAASA